MEGAPNWQPLASLKRELWQWRPVPGRGDSVRLARETIQGSKVNSIAFSGETIESPRKSSKFHIIPQLRTDRRALYFGNRGSFQIPVSWYALRSPESSGRVQSRLALN
jgi:hypothetical protein